MNSRTNQPNEIARLRVFGVFLILIGLIFAARLFYLQIVQGSYYREEANSSQTKSLDIAPERGQIYARNGEELVPLVLNEQRWLAFADAQFIEDVGAFKNYLFESGLELNAAKEAALRDGSRYVVLDKNLNTDRKELLEKLGLKGLYFSERSIRAYPEEGLAAQVLGFVNEDGLGQYGVEELYNKLLSGEPGKLKAITDSSGTPLAFEENNIDIKPTNGQDVVLTIDVGVQQLVEEAVRNGVEKTAALGGTGLVMDADSGEVLAMANYPSFEPNEYNLVEDISLFTNNVISSTYEPGSVMKVLVAAAALDTGVIDLDYEYFDQDRVVLDGFEVKNSTQYGAQQRTFLDILVYSLNTGSIQLLKELGGGEVNEQARTKLYDYYYNRFGLGQKTGIDLQNEAIGRVFGPNEGFGLNIRYGNMTFGQGLSVTPIQIARSYAATLNGGKLVTPHVVSMVGDKVQHTEQPQDVVLKQSTVQQLSEILQQVGEINYRDSQVEGYEISGKTGTAEIPDAEGGYIEGQFLGTFAGYVKSPGKTYVIFVTIDRPQVRFTSLQGSAPIWKDIVKGLVNSGKVN